MSPTVASAGAVTEMRTRASVMIGHTIPVTNSVNAKTPTATARSSPVTLPAATPYAPSAKRITAVIVRSPGPCARAGFDTLVGVTLTVWAWRPCR